MSEKPLKSFQDLGKVFQPEGKGGASGQENSIASVAPTTVEVRKITPHYFESATTEVKASEGNADTEAVILEDVVVPSAITAEALFRNEAGGFRTVNDLRAEITKRLTTAGITAQDLGQFFKNAFEEPAEALIKAVKSKNPSDKKAAEARILMAVSNRLTELQQKPKTASESDTKQQTRPVAPFAKDTDVIEVDELGRSDTEEDNYNRDAFRKAKKVQRNKVVVTAAADKVFEPAVENNEIPEEDVTDLDPVDDWSAALASNEIKTANASKLAAAENVVAQTRENLNVGLRTTGLTTQEARKKNNFDGFDATKVRLRKLEAELAKPEDERDIGKLEILQLSLEAARERYKEGYQKALQNRSELSYEARAAQKSAMKDAASALEDKKAELTAQQATEKETRLGRLKGMFGLGTKDIPGLTDAETAFNTARQAYMEALAPKLEARAERENAAGSSSERAESEYRAAFLQRFVLAPARERLTVQHAALEEVAQTSEDAEKTRAARLLESLSNMRGKFQQYKWHTRAGIVTVVGVTAFGAAAGAGAGFGVALLVGTGAAAWRGARMLAGAAAGASASSWAFTKLGERVLQKEQADIDNKDEFRSGSYANLLQDFARKEKELVTAESEIARAKRIQEIGTVAAGVGAGAVVGGVNAGLSYFDGAVSEVPRASTFEAGPSVSDLSETGSLTAPQLEVDTAVASSVEITMPNYTGTPIAPELVDVIDHIPREVVTALDVPAASVSPVEVDVVNQSETIMQNPYDTMRGDVIAESVGHHDYKIERGDTIWDIAEGETNADQPAIFKEVPPENLQALIDLTRDALREDPKLAASIGLRTENNPNLFLYEGDALTAAQLQNFDALSRRLAEEYGLLDNTDISEVINNVPAGMNAAIPEAATESLSYGSSAAETEVQTTAVGTTDTQLSYGESAARATDGVFSLDTVPAEARFVALNPGGTFWQYMLDRYKSGALAPLNAGEYTRIDFLERIDKFTKFAEKNPAILQAMHVPAEGFNTIPAGHKIDTALWYEFLQNKNMKLQDVLERAKVYNESK